MTDVVTNFKKVQIRDRRHLANVGKLRSCISGVGPCHPHHLRCTGEGGFRKKPGDNWVVPLTVGEHVADVDAVHSVGTKREEEWFLKRGINCKQLAADLYDVRGDVVQMQMVVDWHRCAW